MMERFWSAYPKYAFVREVCGLIWTFSTDLGKDIQARHDGEEKYGFDVWFAGHRDGESGVNNPDTADIKGNYWSRISAANQLIFSIGYKDAVLWIQQQIESDEKYQSDDTRFWVDVQAI